MMKRFFLFIVWSLPLMTFAQLTEQQIDSIAQRALKAFDVPGIAVGVVKDGKLIHAKGYGVRSLANNLPVNEETLFGIASNSKAFTTTAIAMLVEEGKVKWDDKVRKYIPEFELYNPFMSAEFTIRDLVTHRGGLGLGAGDLMFFPEGGNITVSDIIHNMRYIKPVSSFRSTYEYNNNFYNIAGEVVKRASGMSWEEFIEQRIMKPLGFEKSKASYNRVTDKSNIIDAHAPVNGKIQMIPHDWSETANAAGGIMSNIKDLSKWVMMQLNNGKYGEGQQLFKPETQWEMWSIQTPIPVAMNSPYGTQFQGYGLGWVVSDVKGMKQVGHTGGLLGTVTQITLIPSLNLGIIVLTNQQSGSAFHAITNSIKDAYLGYENRDWVGRYEAREKKMFEQDKKVMDSIQNLVQQQIKYRAANPKHVMSQDQLVGMYSDLLMGDIEIKKEKGNLRLQFLRSPRLVGNVVPLNTTTWIVQWDDRSYYADAYMFFTFDHTGKSTGFKMQAISDLTDFSFDFHDLNIKRKN